MEDLGYGSSSSSRADSDSAADSSSDSTPPPHESSRGGVKRQRDKAAADTATCIALAAEHEGRKRQFAHKTGNWATYVYVTGERVPT